MAMVVTFYMLGSLEIQIGNGPMLPLGDTLAAKILAYLAFRGTFCSRDEIVAAVWGPEKASGKDKLTDEAYQKQISILRSFLSGLGLPPPSYLNAEPNGLELRDGTFRTDVARFNDLLAVGSDRTAPAAERLSALQEADGLRRGYFLDGMHCEWITAEEDGARRLFTAKFQEVRTEIQRLQAPQQSGHSTFKQVAYCDGLYDVIPQLRSAIAKATTEIILCGISLNVTISVAYDLLLERLSHGVKIKFLLLDPDGRWLPCFAPVTGTDEVSQRQEGTLTLRRIAALASQVADAGTSSAALEASVFDRIIGGRIYAIDPDTSTGQLFYFPYLYDVAPSLLPGYLWTQREDGPYPAYVSEVRRLWDMSHAADMA